MRVNPAVCGKSGGKEIPNEGVISIHQKCLTKVNDFGITSSIQF